MFKYHPIFGVCITFPISAYILCGLYRRDGDKTKTLFESAAKRMKKAVGHYDNIKGAMEDLLGEWNDNTDEIESGADVTLKVFVGGIIGAAVAASSGGSLAPAAYSIVLSGISGSKTLTDIYDLQEYVLAIITTRSILDTALSNVQAYYSGGNVLVENDSQQDEYHGRLHRHGRRLHRDVYGLPGGVLGACALAHHGTGRVYKNGL